MNGFTLLIGSAVIFLIAYVVYGSWLAKQWGIDPKRKTPAETQKDGIDYFRQNRLFFSVTTSLQSQAPARSSARLPRLFSDGFPSHCGLSSAASSSAAYMTTVLWWLLCAIKARVSAKLSKPTSEKKPRFSSPSLPGLHC